MNSKLLIQQIYLRLSKWRFVILPLALLFGIGGYYYAKSRPVTYTAISKVYPQTAGAENSSSASNKLSELMGGGSATKSLSQEATISLEEVANSRKTRDAVVAERLPQFANKMIAEVLIDQYNKNKPFYTPLLITPSFDSTVIALGGDLLRGAYVAKVNKNSLLEITMSATDQRLLSPVSYILIDKISVFYKELRRRKAKEDYDFTQGKVDSLQKIMNAYDRQLVAMNKTSLFIPNDRLQYTLPRENLLNDKMRVMQQMASAAANREDALWRLQKVTPVVDILDKPQPPFQPAAKSGFMFAIGGLALGLMLIILVLISPLLLRFVNNSIKESVFPAPATGAVTTTA